MWVCCMYVCMWGLYVSRYQSQTSVLYGEELCVCVFMLVFGLQRPLEVTSFSDSDYLHAVKICCTHRFGVDAFLCNNVQTWSRSFVAFVWVFCLCVCVRMSVHAEGCVQKYSTLTLSQKAHCPAAQGFKSSISCLQCLRFPVLDASPLGDLAIVLWTRPVKNKTPLFQSFMKNLPIYDCFFNCMCTWIKIFYVNFFSLSFLL